MEKLDKLHEAFMNCTDRKDAALRTDAIREFDEVYRLVSNRYLEQVLKKTENSKQNGNLTGRRLAELERSSNRGRNAVDKEFIDRISSMINPENKKQVSRLLCNLAVEGNLEEARDYEIFRINRASERIYVYKKQGVIVGTDEYGIDEDSMYSEEQGFDINFDLEVGEDENKIKSEFSNLKNKILERDPYAEIKIMDRLIVVNDKSGESLYIIQEGRIIPAKIDTKSKIKVNLDPEPRELLDINRNGAFSRLQKAIRKKLLRKQGQGIVYNGENKKSNSSQRRTEFKGQIRSMDNYDNTIETGRRTPIERSYEDNEIE